MLDMGDQRILRSNREYHGISWTISENNGILGNTMEYQGTSGSTKEYQKFLGY